MKDNLKKSSEGLDLVKEILDEFYNNHEFISTYYGIRLETAIQAIKNITKTISLGDGFITSDPEIIDFREARFEVRLKFSSKEELDHFGEQIRQMYREENFDIKILRTKKPTTNNN